jgi:PatG Domain
VPSRYCPTCGNPAQIGATGTFIYAIGKIEARFPRLSVEKEFAQVSGRTDTRGLTDRQVLHSLISKSENRYLARQLCWVLTIRGVEAYVLVPRDPNDLQLLVEALRPAPSPMDLDVVIGLRGPVTPPEMCNGLMVPIAAFDQIYSFDRDALIKAVPVETTPQKDLGPAAEELFDRIMLMTENTGGTDEYRALNYLAVRYHRVYHTVAEAFARDESLSAVDVRPSPLSGARKVVEAIFSFTNRTTDVVTKQYARVDVTEEFPFLVSKLAPYYDR